MMLEMFMNMCYLVGIVFGLLLVVIMIALIFITIKAIFFGNKGDKK